MKTAVKWIVDHMVTNGTIHLKMSEKGKKIIDVKIQVNNMCMLLMI